MQGVSSKDLLKVRQNAKRKRTAVACTRCKSSKTKCSDYRPCSKCKKAGASDSCIRDMDFSRIAAGIPSRPASFPGDERSSLISNGHRGASTYASSSTDIRLAGPFQITNLLDFHMAVPHQQQIVQDQTADEMLLMGIRPDVLWAQILPAHLILQAQHLQNMSYAQPLQPNPPSHSPLSTSAFLPYAVAALLGRAAPVPTLQPDPHRLILAPPLAFHSPGLF